MRCLHERMHENARGTVNGRRTARGATASVVVAQRAPLSSAPRDASHLLALGAPAHAPAAALLVLVVGTLATRLHVDLVGVEGLHRVYVGHRVDLDVAAVGLEAGRVERRGQQCAHGLLGIRREALRELDRQHQEEVPVDEGALVGRHALVLHGLHNASIVPGVRVHCQVHGAALPRLLGCEDLLARALLEVGAAVRDDEGADVDALTLQLRLTGLLKGVHVDRVGLRDIVDVGAVGVLDGLPLNLSLAVR
mmetsp:Transcript_49675/g.142111  ORF Transcript_49675/g.142111 Transcript_49675/m.142111 type:complete len:251 (-) Transcript_49675:1002-1754(-)